MSLQGDRLAIGATGEQNNGLEHPDFQSEGRVWLFQRTAPSVWEPIISQGPPVAGTHVEMGVHVALRDDLLLASAPRNRWNANPDTPNQGLILSFIDDPESGWVRADILLSETPLVGNPVAEPTDLLGLGLAIAADQIIASTPSARLPGLVNVGAVYVFERPEPCATGGGGPPIGKCGSGPAHGPADLNDDGTVDADDLAILLAGFAGKCQGDINNDGIVDADDLAILLGAFGIACPPA